jgi:hypothetical protein
MANRIPFTAYLRIVPNRGTGKRFEIHRSRERMARQVWEDLNDVLENAMEDDGLGVNFAVPGGSVTTLTAHSPFSSNESGVAVKPQFGESPDTLTIIGFYESNTQYPYPEKQLISAGRVWSGPAAGAPGYSANTEPNDANRVDVAALKLLLESAITSVAIEVIGLEVNGVKYGRGGLHFPA